MNQYQDILSDAGGDLLFENGDLKVANNDYGHIQNILKSSFGFYNRTPSIGANLNKLQNGFWTPEFKRSLTVQLEMDGYEVEELSFGKDGKLNLQATRKTN